MSDDTIREGSDNVFADLGVPEPDTALAKADLAIAIVRLVEERGLTQAQAARKLGTTQPKVSDLRRGRLEGFSMDRLLRFLVSLGQEVEVVYRPGGAGAAGLRVVAEARATYGADGGAADPPDP